MNPFTLLGNHYILVCHMYERRFWTLRLPHQNGVVGDLYGDVGCEMKKIEISRIL